MKKTSPIWTPWGVNPARWPEHDVQQILNLIKKNPLDFPKYKDELFENLLRVCSAHGMSISELEYHLNVADPQNTLDWKKHLPVNKINSE